MANRAIKLSTQCGDWEGLYINGELIEEDHSIDAPEFWLRIAEQYGVTLSNYISMDLNDIDNAEVTEIGNFPTDITSLNGKYE